MGVASLVLGILGLIFMFTGWLGFMAPVFGIIGIILGAIGRKQAKEQNLPTGMATAGLVMSIVSVVLGSILFLACVICTAGLATAGS